MGGYETKPNPVPAASMVYDHVARMIYPDPEGQTGLLPGVMLSSTPYNFSMSATIDPSLAAGKLKAAILLIKHGDSTILNSAQMKFYLNEHIPVQHTLNAELYPNPADEESTVAIYLQNSQSVNIVLADIAGHTLLAKTEPGQQGNNKFTVPVSNLATGIYLVGIHTAEGEKIWKVEVKH
jgi:hypothetical protein